MRNFKISKQLKSMKKEHNGPDGHRIKSGFDKIAKNIGTRVAGQDLRFEGPTGKLIYGGEGTDVVGDGAFPAGTKVKVVGKNKPDFKDGYIMDDDFMVIEDND
tara:strand:+ start:132 stop:440 length:309 start_codon:yes stop_codon:yes gene_type:complete